MNNRLLTLQENHSILDKEFNRLLKEGDHHTLKRDAFFYTAENKKKEKSEKRVSIQVTCDILLKETNLKHLCLCTHCKVGYYLRFEGLYGPFSQIQIQTFLIRVLKKVGEPKLLTPYFISQILNNLKTSQIAANSAVLLAKFRSVEKGFI